MTPSEQPPDQPSGGREPIGWSVLVREALRDALALILPVECAGCQRPDRALCDECARSLVSHTSIHSTPQHLRVYAALRYEDRVRRVLLAFKNHHRTDLARPLSVALLSALRRALSESTAPGGASGPIEIIAVPSSKTAMRTRGYHPVGLVLKTAGVRHARALRVAQKTRSQKMLSAEERAVNVKGAFISVRSLAGSRVIIVDDVLTTGATLDEAARAISAAGGTVIAAATMGFTPRTLAVRDIASGEGYGMEKGAK
ncbi:ComF family protein [Salinibacterium sp. NSLL150]|uniref:ComF family protein n=1 Tax=unclassified Salinibacterium TaxID=2632331 RepID=UPI0018CDE10E|nr:MULTISPECIES: phosphoribosyltransferase family protein [unclassified Salinibacterium]MBH0098549.1 ComF family protein [Salinibacterium sp. NSLL35]MBH0101304.1 ComF family protein [Salinibacterium sp. NSLL150]MBH0104063.1 ComF family protein [Salinibacterium sp. NSLL16]MBH0106824.1 ComF family protein [Salinibacterium sp. NSLL17]MBH0109404.1 ComF family protein [Salinibacterium sp. NG22]